MLRRKYSNLSLRSKVMIVTGGVITLALGGLATVGILQMRSQMAAEQRRAADSVALGVARAAELAIAVRDTKELERLTNSFLRDQNVLFIAVYGNERRPLATAVRNIGAWANFVDGRLNDELCVVGERQVDASVQPDEFTGVAQLDSTATEPPSARSTAREGTIGRVVVGISTAAALSAQRHQNQITVAATITAALSGASLLLVVLRSFLRRLERLAEASNAISRGDFTSAVGDDRNDEIGRLARSFDQMREALLERDGKLKSFTDTLQEQVRQRTSALEQALAAAEEASRAKSMFLANMSHELRTPLNGVIGMVDLMLAASPSAQQRRYCDIAKSSARALLELINDVLDFSKIEAGKLDLDQAEFDLHELVENVATMFGDRAEKKKIELACALGPNTPRMVSGDPTRLRQVLSNLLSNAVKFTERGTVVLNVALESEDAKGPVVRLSVKDSGIGIPPDRVGRLFKSFSQVDASTTRKFGGTGLGLAISQRIVELMGGRIGVESREGEGSTFWFTVPLSRSSHAPKAAESPADPRGLRVLAVDDNSINREILHAQLASWQMQAELADGAERALEMLREAARAGRPYRFGVLDVHMPGTDGLELSQQIKADPLIQETILISVSSISDQFLPGQMSRHGFAACLTKPVLPSQLYDAIVSSLPGGAIQPPAPPSESDGPPRLDGVRVLLAEDNEINQLVARELLEQVGCRCTVVNNGREAAEQALSGQFDVILMDCQMPELDGFEATKKIREAEKASGEALHRPIIALTANAIKGDREVCLAAGMDGYVAKPIDPLELMRTIRSQVWPGQADASVRAGTASTASVDARTQPLDPPIDLPALQKRCLGNRKLAAKLLNTFESSTGADITALSASISNGDAKGTAALAHKIKGAAANVSAEHVRIIVAELEKLAKADALSQTRQFLGQLDREMDRFRGYLATAIQQLTVPTQSSVSPGAGVSS